MPFDEKGFLGGQITEISNNIYADKKKYFDVCYDLNQFAHRVKFEFVIHNANGQEVISASLFIKILNGFQAIYILAKFGLLIEAEILLRSILEALFLLKITCEDSNFIPEYVKTDDAQRLKFMTIAKNNPDPVLDSLRDYATKEKMEELKNKITQENIKELQIKELAKRANMCKQYETTWRLLCSPVHSSPRSLQKYVTVDNKGDINSFLWGPITDDIDSVLLTSAEILFGATDLMVKLCKIDKQQEMNNFWSRMRELAV